jgi:DNA processing protein
LRPRRRPSTFACPAARPDRQPGRGAIISEWPAGTRPDRQKFLSRNRIIAALAAGTIVVEAAAHSGTMNAARHTVSLQRPLMAVPGPVTSMTSAGCHELIRDQQAICLTTAAEVIAWLPASPPWPAT